MRYDEKNHRYIMEDPLAPARGIARSICIAAAFWTAVIAIIVWWRSR